MTEAALRSHYGAILGKTGDEYKVVCLSCGRKSMYVNLRKEVHVCFLCGEKGRARGAGLQTINTKKIEVVEQVLPFDYVEVKKRDDFPVGWKYMLSRGIDPSKVVFGRTGDVFLCFPIFEDGRVVYWQSRQALQIYRNKSRNPSAAVIGRGRDTVLYNYESVKEGEPLIVVEGVFDALRVNGVATLGANYSEQHVEMISRKRPSVVFVCYDNDAHQKSIDMCLSLNSRQSCFPAFPVSMPVQDPADLGVGILPLISKTIDEYIYVMAVHGVSRDTTLNALAAKIKRFL